MHRGAVHRSSIAVKRRAMITLEDFKKIELRTARVRRVETHPDADRLYVVTVECGGDTRTLVAGVRQWYTPEELTGKMVIIVANLCPVTIRGVTSQGMLLAVKDTDGSMGILTADRPVATGNRVS